MPLRPPPISPLFPYTTLFRSLISKRMSASLEPNNSSAKTFDNSVLPTPVGPTNKKEPIGRYLDFNPARLRSEEHTSELQSRGQLVCRLLLEKKNTRTI